MRNFILFFSLLKFCFAFSQVDSLALKNSEKSYFAVGAAFTNQILNGKSIFLNSNTSDISNTYYKPSLSYNHKSGFALATEVFFNTKNNQFIQLALTPSFNFENENLDFNTFYTRYINNGSEESNLINPYNNEFEADLSYKKWYINFGGLIGFSNGDFKRDYETTRTTNSGVVQVIKGSIDYKLASFYSAINIAHEYKVSGFITKKDALSVLPTMALNFGSIKNSSQNTGNIIGIKKVKNFNKSKNDNETFSIQSLSLNFDFEYVIGDFHFVPSVFFDYYLKETSENKLSKFFNMELNYQF